MLFRSDRDALIEGVRRHGHRRVLALKNPAGLAALCVAEAGPGDMVVCLGAGNVTNWAQSLPAEIEQVIARAEPRLGGGSSK